MPSAGRNCLDHDFDLHGVSSADSTAERQALLHVLGEAEVKPASPKPWSFEFFEESNEFVVFDAKGDEVATVKLLEDAEAIANTPEMYDLLDDTLMVDHDCACDDDEYVCWQCRRNAVVNK